MDSCRRKSKERIGIWIYSIRILVVNKGGGDRKTLGTVWGDILAVVCKQIIIMIMIIIMTYFFQHMRRR
jgi:hypothetical protein